MNCGTVKLYLYSKYLRVVLLISISPEVVRQIRVANSFELKGFAKNFVI